MQRTLAGYHTAGRGDTYGVFAQCEVAVDGLAGACGGGGAPAQAEGAVALARRRRVHHPRARLRRLHRHAARELGRVRLAPPLAKKGVSVIHNVR